MQTKLRLVFAISILFGGFSGFAQQGYWQAKGQGKAPMQQAMRVAPNSQAKLFSLEEKGFKEALNPKARGQYPVVYFPDAQGQIRAFRVEERSLLAPELAAKYPQIKSYLGRAVGHPSLRMRFSVSPNGVEGMLWEGGKQATFLQKSRETGLYSVYTRDPETALKDGFVCKTVTGLASKGTSTTSKGLIDDQTLRRYRIAVSATGEYTKYHGGTKADALAAINATLTRVNEVFERDLGVTLQLVANDDAVIYTNPSTDPYNGNLNSEVQNTLTSQIGEANYDVGHLFHKDANNGNAGYVGSVCKDNKKGSGFSSGEAPEGDLYDMDFVAHEIGHQFGANHTFSFESEGTGVQAEPASGTTIMGYAGIVEGNNVAEHGDDYFHYYSIEQIKAYLATTSCGVEIPLTDNPPAITTLQDYTIPKSTPFYLEGHATDPDAGDVLTYTWEEVDNGVVTTATFGPTNPVGANFRSLPPSLDSIRYFPKLSSILTGNLTQTEPTTGSAWETLSDVERDMNFALTVRDNAAGGGQSASDIMKVKVVASAGPFNLTSQSTLTTYEAGAAIPVTWDVAGTDRSPINVQTVDILFSADGGNTFPVLLAQGVPNDGEQEVLLPGTATTTGRIMVRANDNIFFAINAANFTVAPTEMVLQFDGLEHSVCKPDDLVVPFDYETYLGFAETTTFSVTGLPAGLTANFSPATATATNTPVSLTFSNTGAVVDGTYAVTVVGTSTSVVKEVTLQVQIASDSFTDVVLTSPADATVDVGLSPTLQWESLEGASAYEVEVSDDPSFATTLDDATTSFAFYKTLGLDPDTTYYWRIKPLNDCGEGTFGTAHSFTTVLVNCQEANAKGLPKTISAVGTPTVTSQITVLNDLPISDVNVGLDLEHTYLQDLVITLTSPAGTKVVLVSSSCGSLQNISATFDDDAEAFVCDGNPAISGAVKPLGSLAAFNGESSYGVWTLEVRDTAPSDGGVLNAFSLDLCMEGELRPDADADGVFDDGDDLCLGTPKGADVNVNGCAIYRFAQDNFALEVNSESCRNNNDGSLGIVAVDQGLDYTVTLQGNGEDRTDAFTSTYTATGLGAGTYTVCISGTDGLITYQPYCFDITITEPDPLEVSTQLQGDGQSLVVNLSGADLYNVELNGVVVQTSEKHLVLPLAKGSNAIRVYTNIPCQGSYEKLFFLSDKPLLYPNPFRSELHIQWPEATGTDTTVGIFTLEGQLVKTLKLPANTRDTGLGLSNLPSGTYLLKLDSPTQAGVYKIVKL